MNIDRRLTWALREETNRHFLGQRSTVEDQRRFECVFRRRRRREEIEPQRTKRSDGETSERRTLDFVPEPWR